MNGNHSEFVFITLFTGIITAMNAGYISQHIFVLTVGTNALY